MVSIYDLWDVVHWFFNELIVGPLKSKMAEIRHLRNRHNVIFSAVGGPIWTKFRRQMQNDIPTVVIWSKLKPTVEFQYVSVWLIAFWKSYLGPASKMPSVP